MQSRLYGRGYFSREFPLYIMEVVQGDSRSHSHDFYEMVYVRAGKGEHWIGEERLPIHAGDLYVITPGEVHHYKPDKSEQLHIVNVLWKPSLIKKLVKEERAKSTFKLHYLDPLLHRQAHYEHRLNLAGSMAFRVEALLDEMLREQKVAENMPLAGSSLLLKNLFCALLILLSRAITKRDSEYHTTELTPYVPQRELVKKAIDYLEDHYDQTVRLADVADKVALSESRISHLFKQYTGLGIIDWLNQYRVSRCCELLLQQPQLEVGLLARQTGFADMRFFYRLFRRHTGCNPTQYRKHFGD